VSNIQEQLQNFLFRQDVLLHEIMWNLFLHRIDLNAPVLLIFKKKKNHGRERKTGSISIRGQIGSACLSYNYHPMESRPQIQDTKYSNQQQVYSEHSERNICSYICAYFVTAEIFFCLQHRIKLPHFEETKTLLV